jgi:hypothetical protein
MPVPEPLGPDAILRLGPVEADRLLDRLEASVPARAAFGTLPFRPGAEAIVFGDSHGDWRSTRVAVGEFLAAPEATWLIGLGDYIDRSPADCGAGSVANALYLAGLAARYPDRVYLVQGNHETTRRIPCFPHQLPEEVAQLWGAGGGRYERILGLLERGPYGMATESGAFLAHGGFPRGTLPVPWSEAVDGRDEQRLTELVWSECTASRSRRGAIAPWSGADLESFLRQSGLTILLRGHDPDLTGRSLFEGRVLTLQTTRFYERFGGVIVARLPLGTALRSVADVSVEHLSTEGERFPVPE